MEFTFVTSIYIEESDLAEMVERVKGGEKFYNVFEDVISAYDDCDYYNRDCIVDDVEKYVMERVDK